jgi:predicted HAD superfamily phosphohydrolase YqeG
MKVRHSALAIQAIAQAGIVIGLKIHTDVMPHQLSCVRIAFVKSNLAPAQGATAVVVNGQRWHASNLTGRNASQRLFKHGGRLTTGD